MRERLRRARDLAVAVYVVGAFAGVHVVSCALRRRWEPFYWPFAGGHGARRA